MFAVLEGDLIERGFISISRSKSYANGLCIPSALLPLKVSATNFESIFIRQL